jgi:3-deoxy-D-manno-octulosonic-acid transferase/heptosyltransferase-1
MENLLVIRLKAIGDVVFTLPALGALREHFPRARITFLTSKENADLLRGFPPVDDVIALDRAALRSGRPWKMGAEFFGLLRRLRAGNFSLVVDFQGFGETAWLARITGAPLRWGSVYGPGRRWAYTRGLVREDRLHPAEWNLQLLDRCGVPCRQVRNEFVLPAEAVAAARNFLAENSLDPARPTLVLQPFTSSPEKNWPLDNYLAVARHWRALGVQAVFAGGPAERDRLATARAEKFCVAAGTPLLVSAGLVQLAALTLGGDTGLGHLAVAQGRRVVMLMMHNRPGACVPFQHPDWALVPAQSGGIDGITVAQVLAETGRVLQPGPQSTRT